jgi:hypothetical protein
VNLDGQDSSNWNWNSEEGETHEEQSLSGADFPTDGPEVVNYYFPVEVVIAGTLPRSERESIQAELIQSLQDAVNRQVV